MSAVKASARDYAEALYELLDGVRSDDVPGLVQSLAQTLRKNKQANLLPLIPRMLEKIAAQHQADLVVELESAQPLTSALRSMLTSGIKNQLGRDAANVVLRETVNANLIGGIRLRIGDRVIDHTIKSKLDLLAAHFTDGVRHDNAAVAFDMTSGTVQAQSLHTTTKLHGLLGKAYERDSDQYIVVESALPLTDSQRQMILTGLKQNLPDDTEIMLREEVVPELIGGIRLRIGDQVIDHTVKNKLEQLATNLSWRTDE